MKKVRRFDKSVDSSNHVGKKLSDHVLVESLDLKYDFKQNLMAYFPNKMLI